MKQSRGSDAHCFLERLVGLSLTHGLDRSIVVTTYFSRKKPYVKEIWRKQVHDRAESIDTAAICQCAAILTVTFVLW